jgi:hypothetical protein
MAEKQGGALDDRRKALEEEFFRKENEKLRQRLHAQMERADHREALASAIGIRHKGVLDHLVALGLDGETVAALGLVPLIEVAWADGRMDDAEHKAVLAAARSRGIDDASPAGLLLDSWLSTPPPPRLLEVWTEYVRALAENLAEDERATLRADVIGRAREIAEATGGFLGMGSKTSTAEREMLERLESAFN